MVLTCRIVNNLVVLIDFPLHGIGIDPFLESGKIVFWSSFYLLCLNGLALVLLMKATIFHFESRASQRIISSDKVHCLAFLCCTS